MPKVTLCFSEAFMKKFNVVIEETVVGNFEIEAETKEEALELARAGYRNVELVLEPGELVDVKFKVDDDEA